MMPRLAAVAHVGAAATGAHQDAASEVGFCGGERRLIAHCRVRVSPYYRQLGGPWTVPLHVDCCVGGKIMSCYARNSDTSAALTARCTCRETGHLGRIVGRYGDHHGVRGETRGLPRHQISGDRIVHVDRVRRREHVDRSTLLQLRNEISRPGVVEPHSGPRVVHMAINPCEFM